MSRAMYHAVLALVVLGLVACLALLVGYPMYRCGFWTALWLGRGAWPALLMGMCG